MAIVAAEKLIAAIAAQRHSDLLAGKAADEKGRDLRRIAEWLVVHAGKQRDNVARFLDRHIMFEMLRPEMPGDRFRVLGFVEAGLAESDRERAHRRRRIFLVESNNGRAVDPAGEECSDRDVGDRLAPNGLREDGFEFDERFRMIGDWLVETLEDDVAIVPIPLQREARGGGRTVGV